MSYITTFIDYHKEYDRLADVGAEAGDCDYEYYVHAE
jgi:hypothetical protein